MNPLFSAGFFAAWSAIYFAAFLYSLWSVKRKLADAGELILGLFALSLAVFGVATTVFELTGSPTAESLASATQLIALPLLLHFVFVTNKRGPKRWLVLGGYVGFAALAGLAFAGALARRTNLGGGLLSSEPSATLLGKLAHGLIVIAMVIIAYVYSRLFITARRGFAAFLGGVALTVTASHDFAMNLLAGRDNMLTPFGYGAFTLGLFVSRLARFSVLRDRLVRKTNELSERSHALSRAFKELRAAQNELVRREQLAAIGELSAVVAHEVRNPLAVITNAVATLAHPEITAEDRATLLKILEEETTRLNQLVGDLLRYAKPLAPEAQLVSVRDMIEKAIAHLKSRADLTIEIVEPKPVGRIAGDPLLLRQAIDNVVNNALQAMPTGGTLTISLSRGGSGAAERFVLAFADTGEGMVTVVRKRALDPFFTTRPSGTGLGLAIVSRVVDAHGGQLVIKSAREAGTEVSLVLPVDSEQKPNSSRRGRLSISSIPDSPHTIILGREPISSIPEAPSSGQREHDAISSHPPKAMANEK